MIELAPDNPEETGLPKKALDAPALETPSMSPLLAPENPNETGFNSNDKLRGAVRTGSVVPPDTAAKVIRIQSRTGLPSSVIERNADYLEQISAEKDFDADKFRRESPLFAQWVEEDKNRVAVAKNDVPILGKMESLFTAMGRGFAKVQLLNEQTAIAAKRLDGITLSPQEEAKLAGLKKVSQQLTEDEKGQGKDEYLASQFGYGARQFMSSTYATLEGAAYGGMAGLALGTPTGIGAPVTGAAGMLIGGAMGGARYIYTMEGALALDEYLDLKDKNGNKMNPEAARMAAKGVGAVNAIIEFGSDAATAFLLTSVVGIPEAAVATMEKTALKGLVRKMMPQILANQTKFGTLMRAAGAILGSGLVEGGEEYLQNLVQAGGEKAAKVASGGDWQEVPFSKIHEEGMSQAQDAFFSTVMMGPLAMAIPIRRRMQQIDRAQQNQEFMTALGESVSSTEMHKKSPEATRSLVERLKQDGPIENVYINVQNWDSVFQGDAKKAAAEVFGSDTQYDEAKRLKADLVIPIEVYAEKLAGTEFHDQLLQESRLHETDITPSEISERRFELQQAVKEQQQKADELYAKDESAREVFNEVYGQLKPIMGESEANRNALFEMAKYATAAREMGIEPMELYRRTGRNIKKDLFATPEGAVLQPGQYWNPQTNKVETLGVVEETQDGKFAFTDEKTKETFTFNTLAEASTAMGLRAQQRQEELFQTAAKSASTFKPVDINSPEFKAWFGDSKVVDAEGRPLRVYHGTRSEFNRFSGFESVGWFSETPSRAEVYAQAEEEDDSMGPFVMPVYLSLKNPLTLTFDMNDKAGAAIAAAAKLGVETDLDADSPAWMVVNSREFINAVEDAGYDGIKVREAGDWTLAPVRPEQIKSAISNTGEFSLENPSILFQQEAKKSDIETLIIQHNLSADNLLHAIKMGGIPVPSLAITKKDHPLTSFGEITLLGAKDMADPRGYAGTKVFGADIYSPRYPTVFYKLDGRALKKLNAMLAEYRKEGGREIYGGEITKIEDLTQADAFRAYMLAKSGKTDIWDLRSGDMEAEASRMLAEAGAEEKLFRGYDYNGNRRYQPHTLENVVKILKKGLRGGENFNYGVGSIRAKFTPQFRSIEQIRKAKDRLMDKAGFERVKDEIDNEFSSLMESLAPHHSHGNEFGFGDIMTQMMYDAASMGVPRALKENMFTDVPVEQQQDITEFLGKLRTLPTEYFEAKILRDVDLAEFSGAVVPEGVGENVIEALKSRGITDIRTYKKGENEARAKAVATLADELHAAKGGILFQPDKKTSDKPPRGMFDTVSKVITLLRSADPSTFQHEAAHAYLEDLRVWITMPEATQRMKDDWATIAKWAGFDKDIKAGEDIPVEAHEKWASGWEAYLMEGKSPSIELRDAFSRMKEWLLVIYKTILRLDVELNDDIRAVMDRTLASQEQIDEAREMAGMEEKSILLPDWMTADEQRAYLKMVTDAKDAAETEIRVKLMKEWVRERETWWKEEKARVTEEVKGEVESQPVYMALSAFQTGKLPDGREVPGMDGMKLSRDAIVATHGEEFLSGLPVPHVFQMIGGIHPDIAAEMFGFGTGGEMLNAMKNAPKKSEVIKREVESRMAERHGDMMTDGSLAERASEAIANEKQMSVFYRELQILKRQGAVGELIPFDAIKAIARETILKKTLKGLSPTYFEAAAAKAGRDAMRAMLGKDPTFVRKIGAAFEAKQRQVMNLALFKEAVEQKRLVTKAMKSWKSLSRPDAKIAKGRNMDLVNAARAILANYGVGSSSRTPAQYMELMREYDPVTYNDLIPLVTMVTAEKKPLNELTVSEFMLVKDAVDGLLAISRASHQHLVQGRRISRDEIKDKLGARLLERGLNYSSLGIHQQMSSAKIAEIAFLGVKAMLTRVESWVDMMDDGVFGGDFRRYIWQPVSDAITQYRLQRVDVMKRYRDEVAKLEKTFTPDKIAAPGLSANGGYVFGANQRGIAGEFIGIGATGSGKAELLGAMLHMGNRSNLEKLLVGYGWGEVLQDGTLNTARWDAFIQKMIQDKVLTKQDFDFLQATWDILESLKPQAQKAHHEIYGYYFNEVTADPIQTPWGTYRGGYFPAVTNSMIVDDSQRREDQAAMEAQQNSFMFPTTGRGFAMSRVEGYRKPLMMDMRMTQQHIDKVLRFIHIEPRVKELGRLMVDREFREVMNAFDPRVINDLLMPWLQRSASQQLVVPSTTKGGRTLDKIASEIRSRTALQIMAMNVANALQQGLGLLIATSKVRKGLLLRALWDYTRSPLETTKYIHETSDWMKTATGESMYEIQSQIEDMTLNPSKYDKVRDWTKHNGYILASLMQNTVNHVVWSAAYNQAVEDKIENPAKFADSAVRQTQGTFNAEDLSSFEVGSPMGRLFKMFYTYFNMLANLYGTQIAIAMRKGGFEGASHMFHLWFFAYMLPAVLAEAIMQAMGGELGDDDDLLKKFLSIFFGSQVKTAAAMIPVVGPAVTSAINRFNDKQYDDKISASPMFSMLETVGSIPYDIYRYTIDDPRRGKTVVKDIFTMIGMATGLPMGALARPVGYLVDVEEGRTSPTGPVDFARGMVTGKGDK